MGGDFNLIFDIRLDADGGSPKLKLKSESKVSSMTAENDLCDIYIIRDSHGVEKRHLNRKLDYFLNFRLPAGSCLDYRNNSVCAIRSLCSKIELLHHSE